MVTLIELYAGAVKERDQLREVLKGCHDAIGELASNAGYSTDSGGGVIGEWLALETGNPSWRTLFTEILAALPTPITMIQGQLEIDHERGVIYFHTLEGYTALRLSRLPKPIPFPKGEEPYQLDYTFGITRGL